jgi:hypothetical protein
VGQAIFPDDGISAMALIKKADRRMYRQKFLRRSIDTGSETPGSETTGSEKRRESDQPSLVSE